MELVLKGRLPGWAGRVVARAPALGIAAPARGLFEKTVVDVPLAAGTLRGRSTVGRHPRCCAALLQVMLVQGFDDCAFLC